MRKPFTFYFLAEASPSPSIFTEVYKIMLYFFSASTPAFLQYRLESLVGSAPLQVTYFSLHCQNIIAYPTTSHGIWDLSHTEVIISHEAKLSGIYETEVWDKSHIPWLVVG